MKILNKEVMNWPHAYTQELSILSPFHCRDIIASYSREVSDSGAWATFEP